MKLMVLEELGFFKKGKAFYTIIMGRLKAKGHPNLIAQLTDVTIIDEVIIGMVDMVIFRKYYIAILKIELCYYK